MKNIIEMLENSARKYPDKQVFSDADRSVTYSELLNRVYSIGSCIADLEIKKAPVAVICERSVQNLEIMFGVLAGGCFYTVIDSEMPADRIKMIFDTLKPSAVIASDSCLKKAAEVGGNIKVIEYGKAASHRTEMSKLLRVRSEMIDTDPAYVLFTSGSTGVPKGAVVSHRSVIAYTKWYADTFDITENTVFGSQTPFYFSMSVSDVYSTIYTGAALTVIPKTLFSFPMKLIEFMNEKRVNTIYWVPSALGIIANWKVLDYGNLKYINKVLFAGEVMPVKQLNYWRKKLPDAMFANLFGPTETTDICTYYIVDREFSDGESLPIGRHCDNCDVFILKDDGTLAQNGEEGELYARGSFLASGYFNNPEKTASAFVQNPLNNSYPETVYKTGDLVRYNENGELIYISRKDFQIKHMGYRIELGEIEAAAVAISEVSSVAAVYDKENDSIVLIYEGGQKDTEAVFNALSLKLPKYMMPQKVIRIKSMPHNANGKTDRKWLLENYKNI